MKYRILPVLLAIITGAAMLTACGSGESKATADEAVNRVYPEGEGKLYSGTEAVETTAEPESTAKETQAATKPTEKKQESARKKAKDKQSSQGETQPTTITADVPKDNVTGANINPNISSIQGQMASQLAALAVRSISLSETSLTVEAGESKEIKLSFNPSNAAVKSCSLQMNNANAEASIAGNIITITGKNAGTAKLTVTSHNGHKALCDITVKRVERVITDDTVLSHEELCTPENANRWCAAMISKLEGLGMKHNTALRGADFELSTAADKSEQSYNSAEKSFVSAAESSVKTLTYGDYGSYEFNCTAVSGDNGEYIFEIAVSKIQ